MKKFFLLAMFAFPVAAQAVCPAMDFPALFKAKEELISIGTDMNLTVDGVRFGEIEERTLRLTPTFNLYNVDGKIVAEARQKILSIGSTIEVKDCEGKKIGTVKENIFKSFFKTYSSYDVMDASGNVVARSDKKEFFSTSILVRTLKGEIIMEFTRPAINLFVDNWTVKIFKRGVIDSKLMIMIPAFKTSADNRERARQEEENRNKRD